MILFLIGEDIKVFDTTGIHKYRSLLELGSATYGIIEVCVEGTSGETFVTFLAGSTVESFYQCLGEGAITPCGIFLRLGVTGTGSIEQHTILGAAQLLYEVFSSCRAVTLQQTGRVAGVRENDKLRVDLLSSILEVGSAEALVGALGASAIGHEG